MKGETRAELREGLLPFALPIMAEQALITLMGLAGALMANSVGAGAASAIGLVNAISNLVQGTLSSLALGGTVAVARRIGAGSPRTARRAAAQATAFLTLAGALLGLFISLFSGPIVEILYGVSEPAVRRDAALYLAVTAAGYPMMAFALAVSGVLRGAGNSRSPMYVNVVMNLVNVAAGRIFILGIPGAGGAGGAGPSLVPAMGALGAAIAIDAARLVGCLLFSREIFPRKRRVARKTGKRVLISPALLLKPGSDMLPSIMQVAWPAGAESIMFSGGKLITQTFLAGLGTVAIAADYLANSIAMITQVPLSAVSTALPPLVGSALGEGSPAKARSRIVAGVWLGSMSMAAITVVAFPLAPFLIGLAGGASESMALAIILFRSHLLVSPLFWAPAFAVPSGLRGAGDGRFTMIAALATMWTVRVGCGWFFSGPMGWGVAGIWAAMYLDWVLRSAIFLRRFASGKWLSGRLSPG